MITEGERLRSLFFYTSAVQKKYAMLFMFLSYAVYRVRYGKM